MKARRAGVCWLCKTQYRTGTRIAQLAGHWSELGCVVTLQRKIAAEQEQREDARRAAAEAVTGRRLARYPGRAPGFPVSELAGAPGPPPGIASPGAPRSGWGRTGARGNAPAPSPRAGRTPRLSGRP